MQRSTILIFGLLSFGALLPAACTQNFNIFEPSGGSGGTTSSSSSHTSTSSTGGTGGCKTDADCDDVNPCTTDTCDVKTGKCSNVNVEDGPVPGYVDMVKDCKTENCVSGMETSVADDTDVPDNNNPCVTLSCSMMSVVTTDVAEGMVPNCTGMQKCDGMGNCVGCTMDGDCPDPGECSTVACTMNKCVVTPKAAEAMCMTGGIVCDGAGNCVPCASDPDCGGLPQICTTNQCVDSCGDGVLDGDESDKDCGGHCSACADGKMCNSGSDCVDKVCNNTCQAPNCMDNVQNGMETDKDCGGATCDGMGKTCADGKMCGVNGDCMSGHCVGAMCVDHCFDGVKDGGESDKDCGGPCVAKCALGKMCGVGGDCTSGFCVGGVCVDSCDNGVKDGMETDTDCGGMLCDAANKLCADGKGCDIDADCTSTHCSGNGGKCLPTMCFDGMKDGAETDVDCGGGVCPACANGKACAVAADCLMNFCSAVTLECEPNATCANGVQDAADGETDVDCGGGTCDGCAYAKKCLVNMDCASGLCDVAGAKICQCLKNADCPAGMATCNMATHACM